MQGFSFSETSSFTQSDGLNHLRIRSQQQYTTPNTDSKRVLKPAPEHKVQTKKQKRKKTVWERNSEEDYVPGAEEEIDSEVDEEDPNEAARDKRVDENDLAEHLAGLTVRKLPFVDWENTNGNPWMKSTAEDERAATSGQAARPKQNKL